MNDIEASTEALAAFSALSARQRGQVVESWYVQTRPPKSTRYKRERYSLDLFRDLLDRTERHLQTYTFYQRVSGLNYTGSSLMGRLHSTEGYLTDLQVQDAAYPALKARLDALTHQYRLETELLKTRR